jgi:hypothetical protein
MRQLPFQQTIYLKITQTHKKDALMRLYYLKYFILRSPHSFIPDHCWQFSPLFSLHNISVINNKL